MAPTEAPVFATPTPAAETPTPTPAPSDGDGADDGSDGEETTDGGGASDDGETGSGADDDRPEAASGEVRCRYSHVDSFGDIQVEVWLVGVDIVSDVFADITVSLDGQELNTNQYFLGGLLPGERLTDFHDTVAEAPADADLNTVICEATNVSFDPLVGTLDLGLECEVLTVNDSGEAVLELSGSYAATAEAQADGARQINLTVGIFDADGSRIGVGFPLVGGPPIDVPVTMQVRAPLNDGLAETTVATSCLVVVAEALDTGDFEEAPADAACVIEGVDSFNDLQLEITTTLPPTSESFGFLWYTVLGADGTWVIHQWEGIDIEPSDVRSEAVTFAVDTLAEPPEGVDPEALTCQLVLIETN
ncbi:MAG: hypothetical protein AAF567_07420 [Actinomycetota bacterium]